MFPSVAYNCETLVMHQMSHNYFILTVLPATVPVEVGADWGSVYYIISVWHFGRVMFFFVVVGCYQVGGMA